MPERRFAHRMPLRERSNMEAMQVFCDGEAPPQSALPFSSFSCLVSG